MSKKIIFGAICKHGSLRRQCETCEAETECARLQAELEAANQHVKVVRQACELKQAELDAAQSQVAELDDAYLNQLEKANDLLDELHAAKAENREFRNEIKSLAEHLRSAKELYDAEREKVRLLREELQSIEKWLADEQWGTYLYMEGTGVDEDKSLHQFSISDALAATEPSAGGGT